MLEQLTQLTFLLPFGWWLQQRRASQNLLLQQKSRTQTTMGRVFVVELEGRSYRCKFCKTHLALADDLISRAFHCRRGKAYLFNNA
ncbi:hypothetical protein Ahy_B08g092517 isoform C [Arachis hypogaea]|nr:hypothetical protein Ahy_B08g092517 isoform C [Arachis hypogaea]